MKDTLFASLLLIASCLSCFGEFRTLVSSDGKSMKAELVSHNGSKVTIRREDGKEFELDPSIFCKQDHESILLWMKENPPKISYDFEVDATKKVQSSSEYSRSWVYEIGVRNDGQQAVSKIKVMYRILYQPYSSERMLEGEYFLEQNLEFNRNLVITSDTFDIPKSVRGGIKGVLVRILDEKGDVITDWVSRDTGMKGVNWESTNPKKPGEEAGPKVEIR